LNRVEVLCGVILNKRMNLGQIVFSQITDTLDPKELSRCVERFPMQRASRSFSPRDQFLCMVFAQVTFRDSLRDIEAYLSGSKHLYNMGIRGNVTRTNLAYANENRDWRIYAELAQVLIRRARKLYSSERYIEEIDEVVYALDASTIDWCLSLFPWAKFRSTKSAIKMHTMIEPLEVVSTSKRL
jgi:hypothetical protein